VRRLAREPAILAMVLLLGSCSGAPVATQPTLAPQPTLGSATAPLVAATTRPTPTAPPALVGEWVGVHNCQFIVDMLTSAGMPDQALLNIADGEVLPGVTTVAGIADPKHPCAGSVEVKHSHFFTAGGQFGSRDANGNQVDDGTWSIVDATTFEIGDVPFHYAIDGDKLTMEPVTVGPCPTDGQWCPEAWKLAVAMPGMVWTRG
jgi:hypothetical protein